VPVSKDIVLEPIANAMGQGAHESG